jgi:hypothetical protein
MLRADELLHSGRHRELILAAFSRRGIEPQDIGEWQVRRLVRAAPGISTHV